MLFRNWTNRFFIPFTVQTHYLKVLGIWSRGVRVSTKTSEEHIAKDGTGIDAPSNWTVPYHLSFVEKVAKKNTFDKSIKQWPALSVLETLREKESKNGITCEILQVCLDSLCHRTLSFEQLRGEDGGERQQGVDLNRVLQSGTFQDLVPLSKERYTCIGGSSENVHKVDPESGGILFGRV
eukprot:g36899.t1